MSGKQNSRFSIMDYGDRPLGQDEKQFQMNNAWVPVTPEKLILIASNPISDYPVNQMSRINHQESSKPGSDYKREKQLHYSSPGQNLHQMGQSGGVIEHNNFEANSANRSRPVTGTGSDYMKEMLLHYNGHQNLYLIGQSGQTIEQNNFEGNSANRSRPVPGSDYMKEISLHYHGPDQNLHQIGQSGRMVEHNNFVGDSAHGNRPASGGDYMNEMLLHYNGPGQNPHLTGQTGQTVRYNVCDGNVPNRSRVLNQIAGSYMQARQYQSNELNSNYLELLLKNNANNIASANRNLSLTINMAARNPLLPKFHPQVVSNERETYADVNRDSIHSASDIGYKDANRLLIPNRNSEFIGSNSNSMLDRDIQCSVSMGIFSEIPHGDSYPTYNLNYVPLKEADATADITTSLPSIPHAMDQLNFLDNRLCTILESDYTKAESTSQEEKDKQEDLASSKENEIQEFYNGLLQQIVDSSSAAISTPYGDQNGLDSYICDKGIDLGFDLNKTPEQKAPKRRKHRPKVIVENKPKRSPNPATQKKQVKENLARKRKNDPNTVAMQQADVINYDCTIRARKSCRKALNFDLENTRYENQNKIVCQQDISHRNEKDFMTTSDYKATEMLSGANTSSALLISQQDNCSSERNPPISLSVTAEEQQIANNQVNEKGPTPAQRYFDPSQIRNNGCMQQYVQEKGTDTITFLPDTSFENSQMTGELICQNNLQMVPNIPSESIKGRGSKRKYRNRIGNKHDSATNALGTFGSQEILVVGENFEGATTAKGLLKPQESKSQLRLATKVRRRSSEKLSIKGKNGTQSQSKELSKCCTESSRAVEQPNIEDHAGESRQIYSTQIDKIICQLNGLNLRESNTSEKEVHKALVPYKGDGSVVPYQQYEIAKKHKPRPKVDLDQETERTWKLLMGMEGSEDLGGIDKEKEKWWEEERNVFRGRADSFIARMHLVQGDRRFSKWKGSVVDSVIGVFLTQNVSDHLSSSAFMSLAAKFPLGSNSRKGSYDIVCTYKSVEEPELCIVNPDDTISYGGGTLSQPTYHLDFETTHFTREFWRDSEISRIKGSLVNQSNQNSEEEFLSSQDSLDSSITQANGGIGPYSCSNSESRGPNRIFKPSETQILTSTNSLQVGKTTMFQEFYNSVNGVSLFEETTKDGEVHQPELVNKCSSVVKNNDHNFQSVFNDPSNFGYPQKQVTAVPSNDYGLHYSETQLLKTFQIYADESSWPETVSVHSKLHDINCGGLGMNEVEAGADKPTEKQYENGTLGSLELPTISPYGQVLDTPQSRSLTNHHLADQIVLQPGCSSQVGGEKDDLVNACCSTPKHVDSEKWQVCSDNSSTQKKVYSPGSNQENKLKVSKARKAKSESEKNHSKNWDKLRMDVHANGTTIERSKDTMDSLDYEAVRCASVKEVSDAIRERGMNNMLAERIKEFLNRLVDDHGSIDLEWLRHVPPDKAKEYLLSIRGLGLKSVECVRLLTLHHLAFPVDTNVGRIAVRLGWVPLQPLPESLQLHLLELYPILESIQKYLWPRLCKLDQKTLYELHYQMITFGKVFCTKNKPNCNACPMRAECRHFASAFTSARLALPGPEDQHNVNMPITIESGRNAYVNMNPRILPLQENNLIQEASSKNGKCEPIIEEPATPEQDSADERDIEEFYGEEILEEDPDQIPTIHLNNTEFAINVQNCMQELHHEGDMSMALVALNVQHASIPTPKLKNVSRLRTEHQVYELPDSHPLLEKMDKREPDDPSPYLLAIWTPGETENSTQPPERRCASQDSTSLCNDKTCFSCNSIREANSQIVRGTLLIPCRTATRGSFPLNGTYFQVNELFADHASSIRPIDIPREWIWNLPRRTVYFGTSVSSIFKGLSTQEIQHCFWRGFVCVRGFDQQARAPRPLRARLHIPASRLAKTKK